MLSAVGLYGLGETNEAGEQLVNFRLEQELALASAIACSNNIQGSCVPRPLLLATAGIRLTAS